MESLPSVGVGGVGDVEGTVVPIDPGVVLGEPIESYEQVKGHAVGDQWLES